MTQTLHLPSKPSAISRADATVPSTTPMTQTTSTTPKTPPTLAEMHGSARSSPSRQKAEYRSVLIHPEAFERFKQLQKSQPTSPWFDLGDLVTAALDIVHAMPGAVGALQEQARANFKKRL